MSKFSVAVQPYSVRDHLSKDYIGTLKQIAEIGYQGIELGPPPAGITIEEQKRFLDQIGLRTIGFHAGIEELASNPEGIADYLEAVDAEKYVALSYHFDSEEDLLVKAAKLNEIGNRLRKRGVQLLYHNHDWEFKTYNGVSQLDRLLQETDPDLVKLELDTYWVKRAGLDPVEYLSKLHGRCPLLHIKDMEAGESAFFAEIGEGILDFKAIARTAREVGTEWLVVEQDLSRRDPIESLAISYKNLKNLDLI
ncbi:sugar phosphate isomerase/epimerase family protein [Paenibacillus glycanilyticus]|uniref:Sugar phosphate isomerase n=1 Tax=Paenibacillus glycanilyticus TaxID=126569 RepID=A0ABQ6GK19_9BACL|nr:sugar phosphate isomerase/epimerase [Paenibacillus glycanilyticus]GLX71284.1 sugar phosphate isomerase [Paenibacillus glycanilyticus]